MSILAMFKRSAPTVVVTGQCSDTGDLYVSQKALSSASDSVSVGSAKKGAIITTHAAVTVPSASAAINMTGYNGCIIDLKCTAWTSGTIYLQVYASLSGATDYLGGIYSDSNAGHQVSLGSLGQALKVCKGMPNTIYINVAGTFVATVSAYMQPVML